MSVANPLLAKGGIGFIGAGMVGTALAVALYRQGYRIAAVASRTRASTKRLAARVPGTKVCRTPQEVAEASSLVFLTVPDDVIARVAESVRWRNGQGVVHCSGSRSLEALEPARAQGALMGAFHPLQTFADPEGAAAALPGSAFVVEGDPPLLEELEGLARALSGWPIHLAPQDRVLCHVSAVTVCGLLVALLKEAAELWEGFQGDTKGRRDEALRALLPLAQGTVASLAHSGFPVALTGPLARGDLGTVRQHLEALESRAPAFLPLYCRLALAALPLAWDKGGLAGEDREELEQILREYLKRSEMGTALVGAVNTVEEKTGARVQSSE